MPTTAAKSPNFTLSDALEFLRSGLHYVARAGTPIRVENQPDGTLTISLSGVYYYEGSRPGEIRFAPIPAAGDSDAGVTEPPEPSTHTPGAGAS